MANKINLGRVTAYADAVAQGYTGTREEFAKDLANWTSTAEEMSEAAQTASAQAQAATDAAENATLAEEKAKGYAESAETAKTASETAQAASETAKESAETAQAAAGLSESNAKLYAQAAKNSQTAAETAQTAAKASADSTAEVYTEFKAKAESGDFDGYSPTVEITENEGSHTVAITDKDGTKSFDVKDGKTGASTWDDLTGKPFNSVGDGLSVSDGVLSASSEKIFTVNMRDDGTVYLEDATYDDLLEEYTSGRLFYLTLKGSGILMVPAATGVYAESRVEFIYVGFLLDTMLGIVKINPDEVVYTTTDIYGGGSTITTMAPTTGANASVNGSSATAVGESASAGSSFATALGQGASAEGYDATALGQGASATGNSATALGQGASAGSSFATALGQGASATGDDATALGQGASAKCDSATALGQRASAEGYDATALGQGASATGDSATALGQGASATGNESIAIGRAAMADYDYSMALGDASKTRKKYSTAIGYVTNAAGAESIALGYRSATAFDDGNALSIGRDATDSAAEYTRRIIHVSTPTGDTDAANKAYVDAANPVAIFTAASDTSGNITLNDGATYSDLTTAYNAGKMCFLRILDYPGVIAPATLPIFIYGDDQSFFSGAGSLDGSNTITMTAKWTEDNSVTVTLVAK